MEPQKTVIDQLTEYAIKNLEKGYDKDTVKYSLMSQGYSRISVEKALENAVKKIAEKIPPIKEKPQISRRVILDKGVPMEISSSYKKSIFRRVIDFFK